MTEQKFKVGDRVSVAGAPGEWDVHWRSVDRTGCSRYDVSKPKDRLVQMTGVFASQLTLLPTPKPEPPVGTVLRWNSGLVWKRHLGQWLSTIGTVGSWDYVSKYDFEVLGSERETVEKILTALDGLSGHDGAETRQGCDAFYCRGLRAARAVVAQIGEQG